MYKIITQILVVLDYAAQYIKKFQIPERGTNKFTKKKNKIKNNPVPFLLQKIFKNDEK